MAKLTIQTIKGTDERTSKLERILFPKMIKVNSREEKIKQIKKMIQDDTYLTNKRLDAAIANLLDEIEHE